MSALALVLAAGMAVPANGPGMVPGETTNEVIGGIRRFQAETNPQRRRELAKQLGRIRDARVTVALMEVVLRDDTEPGLLVAASSALVYHHIPKEHWGAAKYWVICRLWWEDHEREVRRQAERLP